MKEDRQAERKQSQDFSQSLESQLMDPCVFFKASC